MQARAPQVEPAGFTVVVETISYINDMVNQPGQGEKEHAVQARQGDTVRTVLKRFASGFPTLQEALWDRDHSGELGPHVELVINDALLGVKDSLDSPVKANDRIIITGQYIGG